MATVIPAAKLLSRRFHNVPGLPPLPPPPLLRPTSQSSLTQPAPGKLRVGELFFDVPLDYAKPDAKRLRLFARSVEKIEPSATTSSSSSTPEGYRGSQLPWLVYVPGGPGFGAGPPQNYGITGFLLEKGYQVCDMIGLRIWLMCIWRYNCSNATILDPLFRPPWHGPFVADYSGHCRTPRGV